MRRNRPKNPSLHKSQSRCAAVISNTFEGARPHCGRSRRRQTTRTTQAFWPCVALPVSSRRSRRPSGRYQQFKLRPHVPCRDRSALLVSANDQRIRGGRYVAKAPQPYGVQHASKSKVFAVVQELAFNLV